MATEDQHSERHDRMEQNVSASVERTLESLRPFIDGRDDGPPIVLMICGIAGTQVLHRAASAPDLLFDVQAPVNQHLQKQS